MSLDYRLTLAGSTPVEQVAERALPEPDERPVGTAPLLSVNLYERYGFGVTVRGGLNGYVDAVSDDGTFEWEPKYYMSVMFHVDKFAERAQVVINMVTIVRRVLATGPENAVFVFNGDLLLLTRFDGNVVKHARDKWWSHYPAADQLFPG